MNPQQYTPFIINLTKTPAGFAFHSLEEQQTQQPKAKKAKPPPKTAQSKATNRLIKEIGLISDYPPPYEQPAPFKEAPQQEDIKQEYEPPVEDEDIEMEVKRNIGLPECPAQWFDHCAIHPLEVDLFPEFHSGKTYKTPELYQCYRNFMVDAYRKNPLRYLTFVSLRRVLRGDASCLLKIFKFLEEEGIINYGLYYDGNYTFEPTAVDKTSILGKRPQSCVKKLPEPSMKKQEEMDTDNLTVTVINKNFSRTFRVYCMRCKLICGIVWYTTSEDTPRNLCYDCYNSCDAESVRAFFKVDILKKMDGAKDGKQVNKTSWGLEDNIKLLQFMGSCSGRSWDDLMNQFQGKKALEDIIIQFMQFPITNFDPKTHSSKLEHQEIDYTHQEHVGMLMKLYEQSHHNQNQNGTKIEQEQRKTDYKGEKAPNFREYSNLIIRKYVNKMQSLYQMENTLQEANLSIIEQPLCKRIRISTSAIKEEGDDLLGYEDD